MKALPSKAILNEILEYIPATGKLYWKFRPRSMFSSDRAANTWNTRYANQEAFTAISKQGYRVGAINDSLFRAHRVIFCMVTGEDIKQIDHKDGKRQNNKFVNLRNIEGVVNQKNMKRAINNVSGTTGVRWNTEKQQWQAYITSNKKRIYLGYFPKEKDAIAIRKQAEVDYDFHLNHGRG